MEGIQKYLRVVPMTTDHLDQVADIERMCFADPWSRRMLEEHLENQCAATIVAESSTGEVLGYAGVLVVLDEGFITNVAVRPTWRRQGIARELLAVFIRFAEAKQLAFLTLEVRVSNAPAIALYQSLGFEEAGRRKNFYEHPREDAIIMTKEFQHGTEDSVSG